MAEPRVLLSIDRVAQMEIAKISLLVAILTVPGTRGGPVMSSRHQWQHREAVVVRDAHAPAVARDEPAGQRRTQLPRPSWEPSVATLA